MVARRLFAALTAIALALLLTACNEEHYLLELKPEGGILHREVSVWSASKDGPYVDFSQEKLAQIADAYGVDVPEDLAARHEFKGAFGASLPGEFGGAGWFIHEATSMGSVSIYVERFGGDDDLSSELRKSQLAVDRIIDVLLAWLESEFGEDPAFSELHDFVDGALRNDLQNLSLYFWGSEKFTTPQLIPGGVDSSTRSGLDVMFRIAMYFAERDYFDPARLPQYIEAGWRAVDDDPEPLLGLLARALATKMGTASDEPLPGPLSALSEEWYKYLGSLDYFVTQGLVMEAMVDEWHDETVRFDGSSVLSQLEKQVFPRMVFYDYPYQALAVNLHIPVEPLATNGAQQESGAVTWRTKIPHADDLPTVLHATWSTPATEFQERHFGALQRPPE